MEVAIINPIDPNIILKPGGTRAYVLNLIAILTKDDIRTTLVGISLDERKNPSNSLFTFIPILKGPSISSYKFLFNLLLKSHSLEFKKTSVIHVQRPDQMLPFLIFYRKNPKVCTLHGIGYNDVYFKKGKFVGGIYRLVERFALKRADRIIAVDENTEKFYSTIYPTLKDKIVVIPVGIDTDLFKPIDKREMRKRFGFKEKDKIILYVGRFEKEKGLDLLLKSFKEVKEEISDCKLVLVGDGKERANLENLAKDLELKDVTFMDSLEHDEIPKIMNCADVFALSSLHEGMPTVVLEALACGVPVVSTDVGDVHKIVKDGKTGYIVKPRTEEELSAKLIKSLSNSNNFKQNCIKATEDYSREKVGIRIIGVYNETLKKN